MGWWPFSSSSDNGTSSTPSLDPNLQEFLRSQKPSQYETSSSNPIPAVSQQLSSKPSASQTPDDPSLRPGYARKSAFTDGRYDHLWSTYRTPSDISTTNKSDQEKASDLLDFHRKRNDNVRAAAIENCTPEMIAQWDCTRGSWAKKATMCRTEQREIGRCMMMQAKFLRALGYLSEHGRPPEVEEDVQLHADDLYRRMLRMERRAEEARREGVEEKEAERLAREAEDVKIVTGPVWVKATGKEPALKGQVFFPRGAVDTPDDPALPAEAEGLKPEAIKDIKDKLRPLSALERALERAAIANDIDRATETMQGYDYHQQRIARERQERRDAGTATLGDRISGLLGR